MNEYVPLALHGLVMQLNSHFASREKFLLVAEDLKVSHTWLVDLVGKLEDLNVWIEILRCGGYPRAKLTEGNGSATILMEYPEGLKLDELQTLGLPRGFHFVIKNMHYVHVETSHFTIPNEIGTLH